VPGARVAAGISPSIALLIWSVRSLRRCSLLTIKSPEIPLTPREQEARLLTRDYAAHFATTTSHLIDDAAHDTDPAVRLQALRIRSACPSPPATGSADGATVPCAVDAGNFWR
jgi:hypothetical protein